MIAICPSTTDKRVKTTMKDKIEKLETSRASRMLQYSELLGSW